MVLYVILISATFCVTEKQCKLVFGNVVMLCRQKSVANDTKVIGEPRAISILTYHYGISHSAAYTNTLYKLPAKQKCQLVKQPNTNSNKNVDLKKFFAEKKIVTLAQHRTMYAHSKHSTILFLLLFFILSNFVSFDMNTAYKSNNIYIKTIKIQTVTLILGAFLFPIRSIASKFFVFLLFFPSLFFPSIFFLMLHFVT